MLPSPVTVSRLLVRAAVLRGFIACMHDKISTRYPLFLAKCTRAQVLNRTLVRSVPIQSVPVHVDAHKHMRAHAHTHTHTHAHTHTVHFFLAPLSLLLVGIFRATRLRLNPRQRAAHALFKTYIDVLHVARDEGGAAAAAFRSRGNTQQQVCVCVRACVHMCVHALQSSSCSHYVQGDQRAHSTNSSQ